MTYYFADPQKIRGQKEKYEYISKKLQKAVNGIDSTTGKLGKIASNYPSLKTTLKNCATNVSTLKQKTDSLYSSLELLTVKYEKTEQNVVDNLGGESHTNTIEENGTMGSPASESDESGKKEKSKSIARLAGTVGTTGAIGGIGVCGSASGELFGASYNTEKYQAKVQWKQGEDKAWSSKELGVRASNEGEAHIAKGSIAGTIGYLSGKASGSVGKVSGKGSVGANLFKDGKLSPQLYLEGSLKGTVAEGKGEAAFGTENTNVHANAKGEVLTGEVKGDVQLGRITYEKNGKKIQATGVKAEVGAEAYVATGSLSGGFTIFGIDIDIGVSGKAGGVGGKMGGYATTGGVKGTFSAGLGVGAGIDISIDWSNFNLGW